VSPYAYVLLGLVFAALAYREAAKFQKHNGVSPWRWDPWAWAIIVFLTGILIGGILLLVARRTTKPPAPVGTAAVPPAGAQWAADPSGRNQYRWWDGQTWTTSVSNNGMIGVDASN
jgi:hypothetical protein